MVLLCQCHERAHAPLVREHAEYRSVAHAAAGGERCDVASCALHFRLHAAHADLQRTAIFGEQHASRTALEELHAELGFQLVDRPRNRGLRTEQCSAGKIGAALVGDGEEDPQVTQLGLHGLAGFDATRMPAV